MKTVIIILAWKTLDDANQLATKVLSWKEAKPSIIIICNESNSQPENELKDVVTYLYSTENKGYGGGNNIALKKAYSDGFDSALLINPDAYITEENFKILINTKSNISNVLAIGPILKEGNKNNWVKYVGGRNITEQINTRVLFDHDKKYHTPIKVDYVLGAIILIDLKLLNDLGYINEEYFFSGEIADLCFRAKIDGYESYTDLDCIGIHNIDHTQSRRKYMYLYYSMRNRFLFMKTHEFPFSKKAHWFSILARQLINGIIKRDLELIKTILLVMLHVLMGRYGNENILFNKYYN